MMIRAVLFGFALALAQASESLAAERGIEGYWQADIKAGDAPANRATLEFTRTGAQLRGVLRSGADVLPIFDIQETDAQIAFTVVVPGTPYVTVHYMGEHIGDALELVGEGDNRAMYGLSAHRDGLQKQSAAPAPPEFHPQLALAAPPLSTGPASETPEMQNPSAPQPQAALPTADVPSWRPIPVSAAAPDVPATKLPLPSLRDLAAVGSLKIPPMGWASRQRIGTMVDADAISQAAEGLDATGLKAAGYTFVELDDGWQGARDAEGVLHPSDKFPDMKALIATVHGHGSKFGLATAAAPRSCNGFTGSYGHEAEDARAFADWGVDFVVYEWCGAEKIYKTPAEMQGALQKMGEALKATGRDIAYAIDTNGSDAAAGFAAKTGANWWRTGADLTDDWQSLSDTGFRHNGSVPVPPKAHWHDPGLIQAGNGAMTDDEYRMQLNLWAVIGGPMMLGNDVRIMRKETVDLLTNKELIAIDQDPAGQEGKRVAQTGMTEVWAKPLADGSIALGLFNRGSQGAPAAVSWEQLGIEGPRQARDLWWHQPIGTVDDRYVAFLSPHTSLLVTLTKPN